VGEGGERMGKRERKGKERKKKSHHQWTWEAKQHHFRHTYSTRLRHACSVTGAARFQKT
jgi:hypothetical protein